MPSAEMGEDAADGTPTMQAWCPVPATFRADDRGRLAREIGRPRRRPAHCGRFARHQAGNPILGLAFGSKQYKIELEPVPRGGPLRTTMVDHDACGHKAENATFGPAPPSVYFSLDLTCGPAAQWERFCHGTSPAARLGPRSVSRQEGPRKQGFAGGIARIACHDEARPP